MRVCAVADTCALTHAQIQALEIVLSEAKTKISGLKQTISEQRRHLDAANSVLQSRVQDDQRIEQLQQQLSAAFQDEIRSAQARCSQYEGLTAQLSKENQSLREGLDDKQQDLADLAQSYQRLQQQFQVLQVQLVAGGGGGRTTQLPGVPGLMAGTGHRQGHDHAGEWLWPAPPPPV